VIRKTPKGYKVVSHQTGRSFGTYPTRAQAVKRLRQIKAYSKKPR
jgi:hypothetical protein